MPLGGNGRAEGEVSFSKKQVHRTFVGVCAIVDLRRRQNDLPRRKVGECPHHGAKRMPSPVGDNVAPRSAA